MDPTAAWQRYLAALERDDGEDACSALDELGEWLWRGGFPPNGLTAVQARMLVVICRRDARARWRR